jgi:CRISPR/Cas system CSM-associated protein Csm3 (group 7 of RAMP superfamily)
VIITLYALTLTLDTSGAVSAPESRGPGSALDAALPVARDHTGHPAVPATSLAGSLRAHAAAHGGPDTVLFLFGGTRQESDPDDPTRPRTIAVASPVRFLGTRTRLPDTTPKTVHRTRNALDRHRAAVAPHALFTRELLPPGTEITLWLRLDADPVAPATPAAERADAHEHAARIARERAQALEHLLATWRPVIGGSRTAGHGRARLTTARRRTLDLTDPADRRHWLLTGGPSLYDNAPDITAHLLPHSGPGDRPGPDGQENAPAHHAGEPLLLDRVLAFDIVDALHIGTSLTSQEGRGTTDAALLHRDHHGYPVIPGSTWKGLLRSRCEFILRSLGETACPPPNTQTPNLHETGAEQADEHSEQQQCQGVCRICRAFGHTRGRGRLVFLDSPLLAHAAPRPGPDGTPAPVTRRNHVALDRITGGAAAGLLYTHEVVEQARAELRILDEPPDPANAPPPDELLLDVLRLALYDLHTGALGIGHATTRGYGTLRGADHDGTHTSPSTAHYLDTAARHARARIGRTLFARSSTTAPEPEPDS